MWIKNSLRRIFKNHSLLLVTLCVIALGLTFWINFFPKFYINMWLNADSKIVNRLIETISISYITSYIFYYVVVVLKERRDLKIIMPTISEFTYYTLNASMKLCYAMRSESKVNLGDLNLSTDNRDINIYPSEIEMPIICKNINPNTDISIPQIGVNSNFNTLLLRTIHKIDSHINIILDYSNFLDIELLRILIKIKTHNIHLSNLQSDSNAIVKLKSSDLSSREKELLSYLDLFRELENYTECELRKYIKQRAVIK